MTDTPSYLKLGGIYWPLAPYGFLVNDAALRYDGPFYDLDTELKKIFVTNDDSQKKRYKEYKRYFLLDEHEREKGKETVVSRNDIPYDDNATKYEASFKEFNDRIAKDQNVQDKIQSALKYYPQPKSYKYKNTKRLRPLDLAISRKWHDKKTRGLCIPKKLANKPPSRESKAEKGEDSVHFECYRLVTSVPNIEIGKPRKTTKEQKIEPLYIVGEQLLSDIGEKHEFSRAFHALFELVKDRSCFPELDDNPKKRKVSAILVPCSFFFDGKPDAVLSLIINKGKKEFYEQLACAFHGLSQWVQMERRAWLEQWRLDLGGAIDQRLISPSNFRLRPAASSTPRGSRIRKAAKKGAAKFASEALARMAATLMFEDELGQYADIKKEALPFFLDSKGSDDDVEKVLKKLPWKRLPPSSAVRQDGGRAKFVEEFLRVALRRAHRHVAGSEGRVLKGLLSIRVNSQLRSYASRAPSAARILLVGGPGGGKGAAAKEYHQLAMRYIFSDQKGLEQFVTAKYASLDGDGPDTPRWLKHLRGICAAIVPIMSLPTAPNDDCGRLRWFRSHIESTRWRLWHMNDFYRSLLETAGKEPFSGKLFGYHGLDPKIKDTIKKYMELDQKFKNAQSAPGTPDAEDLVCEYIFRYACHVERILSGDPNWNFNFVQIVCGALGGQGAELTASLRQLFGYATTPQGTAGAPGLFQTCSYLGGTLFLDEVADTPIRVQDNLLMPLEERKVCRAGWETTKEDVSNVRIISATHKDLNQAVADYRRTASDPHPQGFRRDLLSRLVTSPPIQVDSLSEYFNYDGQLGVTGRNRYRVEFARILTEIGRKKTFGGEDAEDFWGKVYDTTDATIDRFVSNVHSAEGPQRQKVREDFVEKITMRFFTSIADMMQEETKDDQSFKEFILSTHIPQTLRYLLNA